MQIQSLTFPSLQILSVLHGAERYVEQGRLQQSVSALAWENTKKVQTKEGIFLMKHVIGDKNSHIFHHKFQREASLLMPAAVYL